MNKKHIVIITNLFPNPVEPGRGVFLQQLVDRLKNFYKIDVLCPLPWFPKVRIFRRFWKWYKFSQVPAQAKINEINVIYPRYLVIPKLFGFLHSVFLFLSIFGKIKKMHSIETIDLINAYWVFPDGTAAVWVARKLKIPVVVCARGCDINLYWTFPLRRLQIIRALKDANQVTAMSQDQKNTIENLGIPGTKVEVIHNGVDFNKFTIKEKNECRKELGLPQNVKIILYIGRLQEEKQIPYLIQAASELKREEDKNIKVVIIGEGSLRGTLENMVCRFGLEDEVKFHGEKKHEEIVLWLGASDLLCLPSKREGCPNVVLEALSCGIPVVASSVGAIPDIVQGDNGVLCSENSVEALVASLRKALGRKWEKEKIRQSVNYLSWEKTAEGYHKIFSQIIS